MSISEFVGGGYGQWCMNEEKSTTTEYRATFEGIIILESGSPARQWS